MKPNETWTNKILESSISYIVTFFFSVVLIGSFTYLAFQANADLIATSQFEIDLQKQTNELDAATRINDIFNKGWFSKQSNWDDLNNTVKRLAENKQDAKLEPNYRQELISFVTQSQMQLAAELGQVQGIYVTPEPIKHHQEIIVDVYQQTIIVFKTLEDMISRWNHETPDTRTEYFRTMQYAMLQASGDFKAQQNSIQDELAYFEVENKNAEKVYREGMDKLRQARLRVNLSIAGIVAGVLILVFGLVMLFAKKTPKAAKAKAPLPRKKRR
jgi:hypothetical protein